MIILERAVINPLRKKVFCERMQLRLLHSLLQVLKNLRDGFMNSKTDCLKKVHMTQSAVTLFPLLKPVSFTSPYIPLNISDTKLGSSLENILT